MAFSPRISGKTQLAGRSSRRSDRWFQRAGQRTAAIVLLLGLLIPSAVRAADEAWVKVASAPFTILTAESEKIARQWAVELDHFRAGLQAIVPVPSDRLRPVTVVLFRNDRAMRPYVPLEKGRPANIGGLFVRTNDLNTIMISLSRDQRETRRLVLHEAVHWHLSALEVSLPTWLNEGLAELFATFQLANGQEYRFGLPLPRHAGFLRPGRLLPLAQLLAADNNSLQFNEGDRANQFYAQAWALTHLLVLGSPDGAAQLGRYIDRLKQGGTRSQAFHHVWGDDLAGLQARLEAYVRTRSYVTASRPRTVDVGTRIAAGRATNAEIELAKGALLFGSRGSAAAEPNLRRALELAPDETRAWELLGHVAFDRQDFKAATAALSRAAAAGSTSPLVFYNLGASRRAGTIDEATGQTRLDPKLMETAAADFRRAIELMPTHTLSYEGLAGMIYSMPSVEARDVELLRRGHALSPENALVEAGVAAAELRTGPPAAARARLERLVDRDPAATQPGTKYARAILQSELLKADLQEVQRLAGELRLDAAIALLDRIQDRPLEPFQRTGLAGLRRRLADFRTIEGAAETARGGNPESAKTVLAELVATQPDQDVLNEVLRVMAEIMHPAAPPSR